MRPGQPEALQQPYDPARVEARWYPEWEARGVFAPRPTGRPPFVIMIPPPNVTGSLTMGHVLGESIRDLVVRWQRMEGRETLWVPGMDHAGIATQNAVEKSLRERGVTRQTLGREGFVREVWAWKEQYGGLILRQLRRLGISADWSRERFTLDEAYSRAVLLVFQRLHEQGLIYRGHRIVNWCPRCQTALSDEEVEHVETEGSLWYIRYPIKGTEKTIAVATTRPETMLGDTGVAVSPKDRRYAHLVGKTAVLPLLRREIPIVADELVDPKFGTGAVKITPAHDPNDFVMGERHDLPRIVVMDERGVMNDHAGDFRGLDRFAARDRVVEALGDAGYLDRIEPHRHAVGHCERCGTVIEPYLSLQWFVRMAPLAAPAIEAAKRGQVKFYPTRWKKVYLHWMENIRDWCISRQLWWGHRIPVWYRGPAGSQEMVVSLERPAGEGWTQDEDVLDTWFSSWLWPFATLGWPEKTPDLARYYPNTLMITGSDIIFFWVARMIMAGYAFAGGAPFSHVFFTSIIRDAEGRKMSKSLGNSPDPLAMMDRFGADAVRFTMIYLTPTGQDLLFDEKRAETGKFFANKVWNAARLVSLRLGDEDPGRIRESQLKLTLADRWILSRFAHAVKNTTRYLKTYRFNEAANTVYHFTWNEYCDWYLEMAKPRWGYEEDRAALTAEQLEDRRAARWVAWKVLDGILRLLHPFMPFVTEEIWQALPHDGDLLATAGWPRAKSAWFDADAERMVTFLQELVVAVRTLRIENGLPVARQVPVTVRGSAEQLDLVERLAEQIRPLARIASLTLSRDGSRPAVAASAVVQGAEVFVPLEGLVDLDEERARLAREAGKLLGDLENTKKKLRNQDFLNKARPEIVERERARLAALEETLDKLKRAQESLRSVQS
jgi:valyl-tRNA synthetase